MVWLKFFSHTKKSKDVAKERLKIVLVQDRANVSPEFRANVSPEFLEMMRGDFVEVISRYLDIDENLDIQVAKVESEDGKDFVPALIVNIPIKNVKS